MTKTNIARSANARLSDPLASPFKQEETFQAVFERLSGLPANTESCIREETNPRHVLVVTGNEVKTVRHSGYMGEAILTEGPNTLFDELLKRWPEFVNANAIAEKTDDEKAAIHQRKKRLAKELGNIGVEIESDRRGYRLRIVPPISPANSEE